MSMSLFMLEEWLQTEDVEGFLALGAPRDEYSHEAAEIQTALEPLEQQQITAQLVSTLILAIWEQSFGPFSEEDWARRKPVLSRLVERILKEAQQDVYSGEPNLPVPSRAR